MGTFDGKVVVVSGGGSGIGKAAAGRFRKLGAKVVLAGRDAAKLDAAAADIGGGPDVLAVPTDVTAFAPCQALVGRALQAFGRVDVLVNNAGTNVKDRTFRALTPEGWDAIVRANLDGAFYLTKAAFPHMAARRDGVIVNVVSIAGLRANPLAGAAYSAAKHGMAALGTVLANEEKDSGVRVCNVCPGEVDTPLLEFRPAAVSADQRAVILKPEDVAEAIVWVAGLPPHVSIPELVIKPTVHNYF